MNGNFIPKDEAKISVMDRGFLFGDGVYEVIPVYNLKMFRFEQHINRLNRSLADIKLQPILTFDQYKEIFNYLLEQNRHLGENQVIYLQITRGSSQDRNHAFPNYIEPTVFAYSYPLLTDPYEQLVQGVTAITLPDIRWQYCNIKSISLLANVLLYQEAISNSCAEAILIRNGQAIEGATSNLFMVKNGVIKTPPLSRFILGGVTRDLILELANDLQIPSQETVIQKEDLFIADEVWITSSTRTIYPIVKIDGLQIGEGTPGEIWHKMIRKYLLYVKNL